MSYNNKVDFVLLETNYTALYKYEQDYLIARADLYNRH